MTTTAPARQTSAASRAFVAAWLERIRQFGSLAFGQHLGITILVGIGAALRIAVMIGYQPALWFGGDSGVYIRQSKLLVPPIDPFRPTGYTLFLKILWPTHTLFSVVALQHLMGLAVVVAAYIFLQRRGLPRWLSCLAVVPLLFDALQVSLEQFILVETLFTTVLVASFLVLLWHRVPTTLVCIISGALFFGAWFIKPLALPLFPILVVYLLLRRVGWRRITGFSVAFLIPYVIVQVLVSGHTSVYGSNSSAIYGRAASIADCDRLTLTAAERKLCPGPGQRNMRPDWYIWATDAPGAKYRGASSAYPAMRGFAIAVFTTQPGDYFRQVGKELAAHFVPGIDLGWSYGCLRERGGSLPATARDTRPIGQQCHPQLASANFDDRSNPSATNPPATPLTVALHGYSVAVRTSPVVVSLATLLTLLAFFIRRRGQWWLARDAGMLMVSGLALIVLPVLVGMYEARYALPALPLVCIAGALSVQQLRLSRRSSPDTNAGSTPDPASTA
ncbi:MAG: hypothetical protein QOE61_4298 [Micromonosporaceae bacterium]|nr:hypothetical protein [Micromonosporaceae bacterium]